MPTKKSLGQHWLKDRLILEAIADSIPISSDDTILEIGPGLGTLTSVLLARAGKVIAVEYDPDLARKLPGQFPGKQLEVVNADVLTYDLRKLPEGYSVVANVPYYITAKIIQTLLRSANAPRRMALLVQQEVAEKLTASYGHMSPLAIELQLIYEVQLGTRVPKVYFTPPPKVDSQVLLCIKKHVDKNVQYSTERIMKLVNAGFSSPRKKLRTTLSVGLRQTTSVIEEWLNSAGISPDSRAQELSVSDWRRLATAENTYIAL